MNISNEFPVVGIIAEYNPFHNGHAYQIAKAKELSGADYCVIAMSGDFVQRGAPAVYDKYIRTEMALTSGADLVLEIPSVFATSSAEDFASCGVTLLDRLGIVSHLCFGSECGDIDQLSQLAHILASEPEFYTEMLRERLKQGLTYPEAREWALRTYLNASNGADVSPVRAAKNGPKAIPEFRDSSSGAQNDSGPQSSILSSPNNILGIEYCKALKRLNSPMVPLTVKRSGSGYHDASLNDGFASATGIRQALRQENWLDRLAGLEGLKNQVPEQVLPMILDNKPLFIEDFSTLLNAVLLNLAENGVRLTDYADLSEELEARLLSMLYEFGSFEERIQKLKTRQYTYTRVSRALLHLMLGIKKVDVDAGRALGYAPYARVLGFKRDSAALLTHIKNRGTIPLITKTADAREILAPDAWEMLHKDFTCSHLYSAVWNGRYERPVSNEFNHQIVIL